jgi:hypothetical protein
VIAAIACDRSDRKKTLPRINTDERGSERTYQLFNADDADREEIG